MYHYITLKYNTVAKEQAFPSLVPFCKMEITLSFVLQILGMFFNNDT